MINWQNGVTPINETNMNKLVQEDMITDAYSSSRTYAVGDYCIYENTLYKCTTAISTAENWNSAHWTAVNISDELESIKGELSNKLNSNKVIQESGTASTSNVYSSKAVENIIDERNTYSTVERKIGKIEENGIEKNVYQKTLIFSGNTGNNVGIAHGISNLKRVIKADITAGNEAGRTYIQNNDIYSLFIKTVEEDFIWANINDAYSSGWNIKILLEYTKTTD